MMKSLRHLGLIALLLQCVIVPAQESRSTEIGPTESEPILSVNWKQFLSRHDLVWTEAPKAWHDGPFLGNGLLGSMVHQVDEHTIRISLGRADVEDHKTSGQAFISQSRLPNGYFLLKTVGAITGFKGRLDLYNAEARFQIRTDEGLIESTGLVHSEDMVISYELKASSGEAAFNLEFFPLKAIAPARFQADLEVATKGDKAPSSRMKWASARYEYNPDPELITVDGCQVSRQTLVAGGETGTAWSIQDGPGGKKRLLVSIEHSFPEATAVVDAVAHLKAIENESNDSFVQRHRKWWHDYYPKSFISLDDTRMESFYWIQVYKFGSGARKGRAFMDTMGPWIVENTAWANGWFNLNTQLSYWFLSTANRLEVAESLFTKLDEKLPTLVANMPSDYGDDCAGMSTIVPQTFVSPFPKGRLGFTGELLWTCHDYWLMLERTMDAERTTDQFFPLLKKSVNTYLHFMVEGDDGKVHLPVTRSPEYGGGEDCNFNLALFRWGLRTLVHLDQRYQIKDPLLPRWKDVLVRLVEYPTNENGYMVAKDFPFEKSHRHYSHLMMIYPLCEINIDQPENRGLIAKSVDHWINYPGTGNAGYSWSGAAAMCALQGDGERAAGYLDTFMRMQELYPNNPAEIHPTTMYTETSRVQPVTETPLSLCDSMQLMMLQSWGETIRVFPAVPSSWQNISFEGLLAAGGFRVSAVRKDGRTQFVCVESRAGEPCLLKTDFDPVRIEGVQEQAVERRADGLLQIDLKRGEKVVLFADGVSPVSVIEPVEASPENCNTFGLTGISTGT
ncbi:glycosyl hydrolase family 95 catalytic domain-containing protein [Neorhodopirellula lusitana]|uniref:glycosyl hydrolase family 95 catalytic domain-containing protein n=1 Tax=Neorhodopirellula lusitana TaxID=445327 RepID=UPI00384B3443